MTKLYDIYLNITKFGNVKITKKIDSILGIKNIITKSKCDNFYYKNFIITFRSKNSN